MRGGRLLRKSELAGWRTRSLLPPSLHHFLPIIKLRGLPFYASSAEVLSWLASYGFDENQIDELVMVQEVDSEINSGFALVTFLTMESARRAWLTMHKKPIAKRFIEVFCLLPPCCPLIKKGTDEGGGDRGGGGGGGGANGLGGSMSSNSTHRQHNGSSCGSPALAHRTTRDVSFLQPNINLLGSVNGSAGQYYNHFHNNFVGSPAWSRSSEETVATHQLALNRDSRSPSNGPRSNGVQQQRQSSGEGGSIYASSSVNNSQAPMANSHSPTEQLMCAFCSAALNQHLDHGTASLEALNILVSCQMKGSLPKGLMNTQYLNVPALVYNEVTPASAFDLQLYNPKSWCRNNQISNQSRPTVMRLPTAFEETGIDSAAADLVYTIGNTEYIDLMRCMALYNIRKLLLELYFTVNLHGCITLACLANFLSQQARAYLFITETKLQTLLQQYNHFFALVSESNGLLVSIQPGMTEYTIRSIGSSELTRKKRKGLERSVSTRTFQGPVHLGSPSARGLYTTATPPSLNRRKRQLARPQHQGPNCYPQDLPSPSPPPPELPSLLRGQPFQCPYLGRDGKVSAAAPAREPRPVTSPGPLIRIQTTSSQKLLHNEEDLGGLLTEIIRGTSTRESDTNEWLGALSTQIDELTLERSLTCPPQGCENAFF